MDSTAAIGTPCDTRARVSDEAPFISAEVPTGVLKRHYLTLLLLCTGRILEDRQGRQQEEVEREKGEPLQKRRKTDGAEPSEEDPFVLLLEFLQEHHGSLQKVYYSSGTQLFQYY